MYFWIGYVPGIAITLPVLHMPAITHKSALLAIIWGVLSLLVSNNRLHRRRTTISSLIASCQNVIVIVTVKAGVTREQIMAVMPAEVRETVQLDHGRM